MTKLAEVEKNSNESNASVLRRFSRKMKGSGFIQQAKGLRYSIRPKSQFKKKQEALNRIEKRKHIERMKKLGKIK